MMSVLNSGWTITWQGDDESLYPKDKPTILKAIQARVGEGNVQFVAGTAFDKTLDVDAAVSAAKNADVIIACLGEKAYCETIGNIDDLTLDEPQLRLVNELAELGKPIVLVLVEGRPRIIHPIIAKTDAIVLAYLPGMQGGNAVADVLFGDANPSGKLPFSYPKYPNTLLCYDAKQIETMEGNKYDPEFPFGFGLSYTTFQYSNLKLSSNVLHDKDRLEVSVDVKNTGTLEGDEVVQLYARQMYRSISPPIRELKSFKKISIKPGETVTVKFTITPVDLAFVGLSDKWTTEKGEFQLFVDKFAERFELQ
jgi:beta-glucosidase